MLFRKKPVFIGLHFAKTGGTSVKSHVNSELGKGETYAVGKHAFANDFFAGRPLLAELSARQKSRIRFVFGHGVDTDTLRHFADREIVLFVICRDPYKRFLSSLKHRKRLTRKFGDDAGEQEVFDSQPANPFADNLFKHVGDLAPDSVTDERERLIAILKHFRFVMSTDDLDAHTKPYFRALEIPPMREAKRVYRDKVDPQISPETVYARDDLDTFVNTSVCDYFNAQDNPDALTSLNPFGYDAALLKEKLRAAAASVSHEEEVENAYLQLFRFLDSSDRLEAAKILIDANKITAERKRYFETFCRKTGRTFDDDSPNSPALCYMAEVYMRLGQRDTAADCARRAIEAKPNNARAHFLLGKLAVARKQYAEAIPSLERAIEINPTHAESLRQLAQANRKLGRHDEAGDALARADKI